MKFFGATSTPSTIWPSIFFYFMKAQLILKCNDKTNKQTFWFYYHGPKCKYIFNHQFCEQNSKPQQNVQAFIQTT
jgi:hypothetical protein